VEGREYNFANDYPTTECLAYLALELHGGVEGSAIFRILFGTRRGRAGTEEQKNSD